MLYQHTRIGDIATVKGGKRIPKGDSLILETTAHPYIRARDIRFGQITFDDPVYVSETVFPKIKRYIVEEDDICIVIVGANIGDVGSVPKSLHGANLTENAVRLTNLRHDVHNTYLKYALLTRSAKEQMKLFAAGAAQSKLGIYKVNEVQLPLPSLDSQCKIAAILSAYDGLIENNNKRIKLLEQAAHDLYREWFVHFRFPSHEDVEMVNSGTDFGMIPRGWEAIRLEDAMELAYGKALKKNVRIPGRYPVYGSAGIIDTHNDYLVNAPGIVVGRKGNVGSVFWADDNFYPIDTVYYVKTDLCLPYVFYNLQNQNFINNDAAVPGLSRRQAYSLPFVVPPESTAKRFEDIVSPIFQQVYGLRKRHTALMEARDLLLPRLVSGELDVSEMEIRGAE